MAILTEMHTEIICLSCDRRVLTKWKSYMGCSHVFGTWKFLRIGAGADKVNAAFCFICPSCLERSPIKNGEDDITKIRRKANSKLAYDIMKDIEKSNSIVIIATCGMVETYLAKTRPCIDVGWGFVRASVQELPGDFEALLDRKAG